MWADGATLIVHAPALQVKTVYLLVRPKQQTPAAQRVCELLCSPLFNQLHQDILSGKRNQFARVHPVEGDLTRPGLGLSHKDLRLLRSSVNVVLHCGGLDGMEADVQQALR
jgi:thioester reductase-like protein